MLGGWAQSAREMRDTAGAVSRVLRLFSGGVYWRGPGLAWRTGGAMLITLPPFAGRRDHAMSSLRLRSRSMRFVAHRRNGPQELDSAVSEILLRFQAAKSLAVWLKYTASGVRRSSEL